MTVLRNSLRSFLSHKGRMLLSAIAVMLSVAFVSGTLVFTDTMNATFDKLFSSTSADVTVTPKGAEDAEQPDAGKPGTLPADALAKAKQVDGVRSVDGVVNSHSVAVVNSENENMGSSTGAPTIAGNWNHHDREFMEITSGHAPRGPDQIMVDNDTADKHDLQLGDKLRTVAATGERTARISGFAAFRTTNPGAAVVYFDTETAQKFLLESTEAYTGLAVTAEPNVTHELLKKNVSEALGSDTFTFQTQQEAADSSAEDLGSFLDVMKYAMLGFAGIALLVGIFLIVNTFSMLVAQRTREIGLMRALGSSRKQVNRSVLLEALLLGVIGSVLGVLAGVGLAIGLMKLMGTMGMELDTSELTIQLATPVIGLSLGILVTVLAAYLPARRAGKVSPMAALRDAGTPADGRASVLRGVLGTLLAGGGVSALVLAAQADEASEGSMLLGVGVLLSLVGFVVVGPLLAGVLVRGLSLVVLRLFGPVGRLAERNALRNPRRTGATGAALMIGLALVACLSVVGSSMVASATDELDKSVGADYIVESNTGQLITGNVAQKIRDIPELAHASDYRVVPAEVRTADGARTGAEDLIAASPTYTKDVRVETVAGDLADAYGKDAMSVDRNFARKHDLGLGDTLSVSFEKGRTAQLTVRAITSSEGTVDRGAFYTNTTTAQKYLSKGEAPLNLMMFGQAKEGQEAAAYTALKDVMEPYPQYQVRDQADYKQNLRDQVGQLLNMVYGLLALAIVVAILGVVNTLALSIVERTREIGLMRAIGLSRRQLRRMVRLESVVIALFGALLGLGLGMGWGATAQRLLALEGLKVLEIPWPTIGLVFAGSAVVGLVAALVPAFRAGRMNVLRAIATE